jgi:serine phosphatase RsbU (regulator of sigma subunit)
MDPSFLEKIPLFSTIPVAAQQYLVDKFVPSDFPAGALVCREGEIGDRLYVIESGQVQVIQALGTEEERVLNVLGPGEYFGEMSLLERQGHRTASIISITPVKFFEMTRTNFDKMLDELPTLTLEMLRELSLRLREVERATIRDLQEKNRQLALAYTKLQEAQAQIIEKERLERELQVARHIQMSLLPKTLPDIPGFDFGAHILPARAVGGDLFDFIVLNDHSVGVCIGDVSDKGVPAALFMALTRSLLRAEASSGSPPEEVLQRINRHLLDMNDARMFVSLLYGILDTQSRNFNYARAGHEVPTLIETDGSSEKIGHGNGQILGLFSEPVLDIQSVQISLGGALVLHTDGVTDATNSDQDFFGMERLQSSIKKLHKLSAQQICRGVVEKILEFQGNSPQFDDITLVTIKSLS